MGRQKKPKRTGETRRNDGFSCFAREGGTGPMRRKQFKLDSTEEQRDEWLAKIRTAGKTDAPKSGSFEADVAEYLSRVTAMPSYKARKKYLELWLDALGRDRRRSSITATEIERILQHWLVTPTKPEPGKPGRSSGPDGLSGDAVRLRRTALLQVWVKLDGKAAKNPVRETTLPRGKKPELRSFPYPLIARIIDAMPRFHNGAPNLARYRAAVMAYTGLPPALLKTVRKGLDLNFDPKAPTVRVEARKKGGGVEPRTLPLTPQGLAAFKAFDAVNAYGTFVTESVNTSYKTAAAKVGQAQGSTTLYALRHSFGAQMYRRTKDRATVGRMLVHSEDSRATARYVAAANEEVNVAAAATFGASIEAMPDLSLPLVPAAKTRRNVARNVARVRNIREYRRLQAAV